MKLTVVGGGSTYTPELADGLARLRDQVPVSELVLMDPDRRRLEIVGGLSARILARHGHSAKITTTSDLDEAIDGAGAVLLQLRVGGQAARQVDETLPLACGCVGQETTGAGGLAKALRTVPIVLDIAARVAERAPGAWIVNFTNPVGIVTRALLQAGHRAVGLCNVAIGMQRRFAGWLDVEPSRITLDHVGLNHLTWERAAFLRPAGGGPARDVLPDMLLHHAEELADLTMLPADVLRRLSVVPSYYLRYFYGHDAVVAEQRVDQSRAEQVAAIERQLLEMYADPNLDEKPALLGERGGAYYSEAALELLRALLHASGTGERHVVNVRNSGTLPFLADDAVIEVPAMVSTSGVTPLPVGPVDPRYAGLIAHTSAYEALALEAATGGGEDRVFDALLAHPLIGQTDMARRLTSELIAANRHHLPWATA